MKPAATTAATPLSATDRQLGGRAVRGLTVLEGRLRGLRARCSVDQLTSALAALGWTAAREPIEDGAPSGPCLAVIQTWGSPWLDVLEPTGAALLDPPRAARLSVLAGVDVLHYDYDFAGGSLRHVLFRAGVAVETLDQPAAFSDGVIAALAESYRSWHMRDWGLTFQRLADLELPFSPQLIVEAYFLDLGARSQTRTSRGEAPGKPS